MKLFKYFFAALILVPALFAQVTTVPEFPTEQDSIIITFNANEATRTDLVGYTGTVYTHSGVLTTEGNWQHVVGDWGNNNNQPALTRIGEDLYQLVIGYPREFYSVTDPGEEILQLNFVFRNSAGNGQTEDIFVPLFPPGVNVRFELPENNPSFVLQDEEVDIRAVAANSTTMSLYLEENLLTTSNNDTINYVYQVPGEGSQWLYVVAEDGEGGEARDSVRLVVRGETVVEELPPGVINGINYSDANPTEVTLVLHAPDKEFVYMLSDFSDWEADNDYLLKQTPDGEHWWITINGLTPGQQYPFQYFVDGEIKIADPYSELILHPEDQYISPDVYPGLIPYPEETSYSVSVFQPGASAYQWEVPNFNRPKTEDLIIYELLVRDFVSTHSYTTLTDTLDYLENLGVNAIELMPVMEFEGNESWGYNPAFHFALDKYYGRKQDFKEFIDECHKRGIAVILDIVLNHMYGRSSLVRLYNEGDYGNPTEENPWFNVTSPNPVFSWGYDLNHERQAVKDYIDRVNRYWIEEYNVDGYRFDFTKGFTQTPGDGSAYDASRIAILRRMKDAVRNYDPSAYLILEHFGTPTENRELANTGMLIWGNLNYNYSEAAMGYHDSGKSNFSGISYKSQNFATPNLVGYMESHDEERLMYKNLEFGNSSGSYDVQDLPTALQRIKLAATFFITVPGPKMIWQFGELGYDFSIDYNGRVGNKPIRWDYFQDLERRRLYEVYSALNNIKKEYDVFGTDDFSLDLANATKTIHLNHESMSVAIIGNFDVVPREINPKFQQTGKWYDFFTGDSIEVTNTDALMELGAGEFHLYSTVKLPTPDPDIITDLYEYEEAIVEDYSLQQNYPNPFNPSTRIKFSLPEASFVTLKVFNILGQEVTTLVNEQMTPGVYEFNFDANGLSSGVYIYRLDVADKFTEMKKMVLLK